MAILALSALAFGGCADLGFGVDVDSDGANPYWYSNGYLGSSYWSTPVWNYGPIYNPTPWRPPYLNPGVGPSLPPPTLNQKPIVRPPVNVNTGVTGNPVPSTPSTPSRPTQPERPGNNGRPN